MSSLHQYSKHHIRIQDNIPHLHQPMHHKPDNTSNPSQINQNQTEHANENSQNLANGNIFPI